MQLIDTHVHLNFDVFQEDLPEVRSRYHQAGVVRLVHSCVTPAEFPRLREITAQYPEISLSVGLHPLDADQWGAQTALEIRQYVQECPRIVAIGETGLDFYKADNQEWQKEVFWQQLTIAHEFNLPLIIHCREAATTLKEVIGRFWQEVGSIRAVMHCWAGTPEETQWFLNFGFYISFSGVVTFKNATAIQASAKIVPSDRLLIETDCPFLSPVPKRGKRNEPAHVQYVAEYLANLRSVSLESLAQSTTENAIQLFRLEPINPEI